MVTTVEIPIPTPSLNRLNRMHYQEVKRLRDRYTVLCRLATSSVSRARPYEHRRVMIERRGVRLLDFDNLVGGCKPLVDALNRAGLIWDDSPQYVTVGYTQTKVGAKAAKTIVTVA